MGAFLVCLLVKIARIDPRALHETGIWLLRLMVVLTTPAPLLGWIQAKRTLYVLTNRRAVVLVKRWNRFKPEDSFPASALHQMETTWRRDGSGSIVFGRFGMGAPMGFLDVPDLAGVEPLVRALAASARPAASCNTLPL
jgi:hypothetical protein